MSDTSSTEQAIIEHVDRVLAERNGRWHVDKRIPVALMVGFVLQFAGLLIGAGVFYQQNADQNVRLEKVEKSLASQILGSADSDTSVAVLSSEVRALIQNQRAIQVAIPQIQQSLARIEGELRRNGDK